MKLNKKFLASFTALTMAVTPMAAFADATDGSEITGTGSVTTLETEIYNVVLPTSSSVDFKVDPYGLLSLTSDATLEDVVSAAAGTVTSSATAIVNKSSVGIDVGVELYFDSSAVSNSAVKLGTRAEAEAGTADLCLEVIQLSGASLDTVVTGAATSVPGVVSDKAFTLSTSALAITGAADIVTTVAATVTATGSATTTSGTAIDLSLGDVSYAYYVTTSSISPTGGSVKVVPTLSEDAVKYTSENVYAFAISGYANPTSTCWSEIADAHSDLQLTMKFTISKKSDEAKVAYTDVYAVENSKGVWIAKTAYVGTSSSNPGFSGITAADIKNPAVNGTAVSGVTVSSDYVVFPLSSVSTGENVITFTVSGVNYKVVYNK